MNIERISTLDGFRAVAVLLVILFHFFSRWAPPLSDSSLYPYGNTYGDIALFRYGYLGVEFFFVISGFVISMTLGSSKGPVDFLVKRIARLWPAMLLCSSLTFITLAYVPHAPFATNVRNFVPSLLFMDPFVSERLFGHDFSWMDGAYWSLFVEARFYFWAALIYFNARTRFLKMFFGFTTAIFLLSWAAEVQFPRLVNITELMFFPAYLPWFTIGIAFFYLYVNQSASAFVHFVIIESLGVLALQASFTRNIAAPAHSSIGLQLTVFVGIVVVFYVFIYRPHWLSVFSWRPLTMLGAASYSLYLMHQYIGLTLLRYLTELLGAPGEFVAIAVILLLIGSSILISRYWETPFKHIILRLLLPIPPRTQVSATRERLSAL